jgi:MFS family permease
MRRPATPFRRRIHIMSASEMSSTRIKIGIYGISLLMVGVIGVSGALSVIGSHFEDASQTMIQNIISIPCLVIIPTTVITGKLMDTISKKTISIAGSILFIIGGLGPAFIDDLYVILFLRALLGVGVGISQSASAALIAENFDGAEREKVQGHSQAAQMLSSLFLTFAGGLLADISWDKAFLIHAVGFLSLFLAVTCLPAARPAAKSPGQQTEAKRPGLTRAAWIWAGAMFFLFIGGQVFDVYISFLVTEKDLGTATQSGNALALFSVAGVIIGLIYGKLAGRTKKMTIALGLSVMIAGFLLFTFAVSVYMIYIASFIQGAGFSICMPAIIVGSAGSVPVEASGMAVSIAMCAQNLAQFLCPYIFNPITASIAQPGRTVTMSFGLGTLVFVLMLIPAVIWGMRGRRDQTA